MEALLQDSQLSEPEGRKIRLILAAKAFAVEHLGLHTSDSYTTFVRLDGPYVSYNLSAAPKDVLRPYIWRFPIVGRTPSKGFFKKTYALREQRKLEAQGYDTYVRGVRAYSTLGYFDDPILSSMLRSHDFTLISTIIHEMLHQTVWIKGSMSFNESLAKFVGDQGTLAYLAWRHGESSSELQHYRDIQADATVFRSYMHDLIDRLQTLYRQPLSREEKIHRRTQLFAEAKASYPEVFPRLKTPYYRRYFERRTLNNAVLLLFRRYNRNTSFFEQALADRDGDLRRTIAYFKTLRADQIPPMFHTR
ncbi:hypothetical protein NKDENANG_03088 [Candidatus Entotheonellaceae bacterium PAL068K]